MPNFCLINIRMNIVHDLITKISKGKTEQTSAFIIFSNKQSIFRNNYFIRLKDQLISFSAEKGATNEVLLDGGDMLHILELHDPSRSKLQIDRANTMNRSTRAVPHQYGAFACGLIRRKH